jgi:hypothetical protein
MPGARQSLFFGSLASTHRLFTVYGAVQHVSNRRRRLTTDVLITAVQSEPQFLTSLGQMFA